MGKKKSKNLLNYPRAGKSGWARWLPSGRLVGAGVLGAIVLVIVAFSVGYALTDVPEPNPEASGQTSDVYYDDGKTLIGQFKEQDRENVKIGGISKEMQQAAISAEDQSFYENRGISIVGLSRAVWGVATNNYAGGGSTITQQYVKNFYLTNERSLDRKVREMFIAIKVDQQLSKDEILANYLNTIYLGRQSYGIEVASQNYFNKPASELDLSESALLAAMIQRPGAADPSNDPGQYEDRFRYVLDAMVKEGYITQDVADGTEMPEVEAPKKDENMYGGQKGYLLETVREELMNKAGLKPEQIDRGGLDIVTTFNKDDMKAATDAIKTLPKKQPSGLQVALVSVDPETGGINAMYGGKDYLKRQRNAATQDFAQAGSTFKPFTLVAGLENGVRLTDVYNGRNGLTLPNDGNPWTVSNFGNSSYGGINLIKATQSSVNTVYAQLNAQVGPKKTVDVAQRAGLPKNTPDLDPNLANVLGTAAPRPVNMANAYATFASNGVYREAHSVTEAKDSEGTSIYKPNTKGERRFNKNVMAETSFALRQVITGGSGSYAQQLGRPAAGKTGTSSSNMSAWFTGYTPNMAAVVAMYRQDEDGNKAIPIGPYGGRGEVTGGSFPVQVWTSYMQDALKGEKVAKFPKRGPLPKKPRPENPLPRPRVTPPPRSEAPERERPRETREEEKPKETEAPIETAEPEPEPEPPKSEEPEPPAPEEPEEPAEPENPDVPGIKPENE